jgi:hypothetical protein
LSLVGDNDVGFFQKKNGWNVWSESRIRISVHLALKQQGASYCWISLAVEIDFIP